MKNYENYVKILHKDLDSICREHTSHKWSNSWENGGTTSPHPDKYMFLLVSDKNIYNGKLFTLNYDDITGLDIDVGMDSQLRIDIRQQIMGKGTHTYFFIENDIQFNTVRKYINTLVSESYNYLCNMRSNLELIKDTYGTFPKGLVALYRDELLTQILE